MKLALVLSWAFMLRAGCVAVSGDAIRAGELAGVNPVFRALDPNLVVGRAPSAGARRVFRTDELARLAKMHQLPPGPVAEICFEWALEIPSEARLIEAMQKSLGAETATIEVADRSRFGVPAGHFVFPVNGLASPARSSPEWRIWKGYVRYGAFRTVPIWAKVRITGPVYRVKARSALIAGQPLSATEIEVTQAEGTPVGDVFVKPPEAETVGRTVKMRLDAGAEIRPSLLTNPPQISAGERVDVEVRNGPLRIRVDGCANRAGKAGDIIPFTNLATGKRFQARVEGRAKAIVTLSPRLQNKPQSTANLALTGESRESLP